MCMVSSPHKVAQPMTKGDVSPDSFNINREVIFPFEPKKNINSCSVTKNHQYPAFQIRWFRGEYLGKMQFYIFPSFSSRRLQACFLLVKNLMSPTAVQLTLERSVVLWRNASSFCGSLNVY